MRLDLDDILEVTPMEKRTGKSKQIAVADALRAKSAEEIAAARQRIRERSRRLLERLLEEMHADDREEAIELHEAIQAAVESGDDEALRRASRVLGELLFFIDGQA
jgi:hypothetical protein